MGLPSQCNPTVSDSSKDIDGVQSIKPKGKNRIQPIVSWNHIPTHHTITNFRLGLHFNKCLLIAISAICDGALNLKRQAV
mmetsp:Transcript_30947/g.83059  ORF Transcript_30947/g.83059 Transcript_30947/m.83059 type:complete len:80 (+) Transcript_30947:234-473(+)